LGAGSAGPIIAWFGERALFVCAAAVVGAGFAVLAIRPNLPPARDQGDEPYIGGLHAGFSYLMFNRRLMLCGAGLTLAFSVGQATNALLPAYTAQVLQQQAAVYGLLDALWSAGAICASVAAARLAGSPANKMIERHGLVLMAAILAALGAVGSLAFSVAAQVLLGATFALCRIRFDALILENTPSDLIGRVRSNVQAGIGLTGILIYLSPWATGVKSPSQLYIIYAIGLFVGAIAIYYGRRGTRGDEDQILTQTQY
jgi:MFS family permease